MTRMHQGELTITETLIRALLKEQCAEWAVMPLQRIVSSGTDNALFRLGDDYVVRLPRIDWAVQSIDKECAWVPKLAKVLKTPISEPRFKGQPNSSYPWPWMITKWNEGANPGFEQTNEYNLLAVDLANFINQLHMVKLEGGPKSRRGVPLIQLDTDTRQAISELDGEIDISQITDLWLQLSTTPPWYKEPIWVHGDILPGNVLIQNNRLSAVIDFSDVGIGDPACDLVIAWSLLNEHSRNVFKESLVNIDEDTWQRGRGWALSIALIMLPYYKNTNPTLATLARRILQQVVD